MKIAALLTLLSTVFAFGECEVSSGGIGDMSQQKPRTLVQRGQLWFAKLTGVNSLFRVTVKNPFGQVAQHELTEVFYIQQLYYYATPSCGECVAKIEHLWKDQFGLVCNGNMQYIPFRQPQPITGSIKILCDRSGKK